MLPPAHWLAASYVLPCALLLASPASADLSYRVGAPSSSSQQPRGFLVDLTGALLQPVANLLSPTINYIPKALGLTLNPHGALQLPSSQNGSDPVTVSKALQIDAPPIDLGQFLRDVTPQYNISAALDVACSAINLALPQAEYFGRICLAPDCVTSTTKYYNARQAGARPACVTYPQTSQDVSEIMQQLVKYDVTYAVRSAGHSTGINLTDPTNRHGFSSTTGVLIDMTKMQGVSFDAKTGIARWELGQDWGTLATNLLPYKAQVAGGRLGAVGPGLFLGGGISWFTGQVGFGSDTATAYEIVLPTADGKLVTATATNAYSDLFWAQKAGLNAFGIVTAVHSRTLPGESFYGGSVIFPNNRMEDVLGAYANWINGGADRCSKGFILPAITSALVEIPLGDTELIELDIFEFFYDGTDPGDCFADFNAINGTLYDDRQPQPYPDFLNKALTNQKFAFSGFNNALYNVASDLLNKDQLIKIYRTWQQSALETSGTYLQNALSFSVVTKTGLAAHRAAGGSAFGVEGLQEGFLWVCSVAGSVPAIGALTDTKLFASDVAYTQASVPKSKRSLP